MYEFILALIERDSHAQREELRIALTEAQH
jgi:hypothetical protein